MQKFKNQLTSNKVITRQSNKTRQTEKETTTQPSPENTNITISSEQQSVNKPNIQKIRQNINRFIQNFQQGLSKYDQAQEVTIQFLQCLQNYTKILTKTSQKAAESYKNYQNQHQQNIEEELEEINNKFDRLSKNCSEISQSIDESSNIQKRINDLEQIQQNIEIQKPDCYGSNYIQQEYLLQNDKSSVIVTDFQSELSETCQQQQQNLILQQQQLQKASKKKQEEIYHEDENYDEDILQDNDSIFQIQNQLNLQSDFNFNNINKNKNEIQQQQFLKYKVNSHEVKHEEEIPGNFNNFNNNIQKKENEEEQKNFIGNFNQEEEIESDSKNPKLKNILFLEYLEHFQLQNKQAYEDLKPILNKIYKEIKSNTDLPKGGRPQKYLDLELKLFSDTLTSVYQSKKKIKRKYLIVKARQIVNDKSFKASKGWYDKFQKRCHLKQIQTLYLKEVTGQSINDKSQNLKTKTKNKDKYDYVENGILNFNVFNEDSFDNFNTSSIFKD